MTIKLTLILLLSIIFSLPIIAPLIDLFWFIFFDHPLLVEWSYAKACLVGIYDMIMIAPVAVMFITVEEGKHD